MQIHPEQTISLTDLEFYSFHGVLEQERVVGAHYLVSLSVSGSFEDAMRNDSIEDTVNYAELHRIAQEEMASPSDLLEHVVYRILARIGDMDSRKQIKEATVSITKKAPPIASFQGSGASFTATAVF
ncbi:MULTISPECIES: dihydroneopterin aldolase [Porphyromonas]|uniref:dihydroneopterin aldolase n=1 Tax=Porphyromonas TaxID=836 RepID=UPI00051D203B|nr:MULTISPECIES: dihydroneopterin aldolase [Porphyromonas]KGL53888.1 hypothetical protein HQ29_00540 [Porphyromonas canoris]KGN67408.1 hypothetical protein JT26_09260 [Porphyromonas sp. COT-108 OH1349]KGN96630.1 hypothetical protein HQ39_00815 [Porphyromonas sp. COT-108 OH2963]